MHDLGDFPMTVAPRLLGRGRRTVCNAGWPRLYVQHRERGDVFEILRGHDACNVAAREYYCRELGHAWASSILSTEHGGNFIGRVHRPVNPEVVGPIGRGRRAARVAAVECGPADAAVPVAASAA